MLGTVAVNDDTVKEKQVTTLFLPLSSAFSLTVSSLLGAYSHYIVDLYLLIIVFLALYLQQFRMRYFSLCMVSFISVYFSALLHMKSAQLPLFYVAICIGIGMAFLVNFVIFKDRPEKTLKRSMSSFHIQINLTLDLIIEMIEDINPSKRRLKRLEHSIIKLAEYARMVSDQFNSAEPSRIWKGIHTQQLRLYIFDSTMLMQTLYPAIKRMKDLHALEHIEVRSFLLNLMKGLRASNVLEGEYDYHELRHAESAAYKLKQQLRKLKAEEKNFQDWLYLLRRIESISSHIIEEIAEMQQLRLNGFPDDSGQADAEEKTNLEQDNLQKLSKDNYRLTPATKRALQAVTAGVISILLGYMLTPAHQYWILLSGFVVFFGTESTGNTIIKAINRFSGTLFGAIVGFGVDHLISGMPAVEIPLLFLCIFFAFYFIPISYAYMIFWITMLLAIMYNLLLHGINEQLLLSRVIDTLIGAGLGASATAFLLPIRTKDKVRETMADFLSLLKENVTVHLDKFNHLENKGAEAHQAFELDQKLEMVKGEAEPLTRRPGYLGRSGMEHQLTVLTAMNYYAKHLVASTNRTRSLLREDIVDALKYVNTCLNENIDTLCRLIQSKDKKNAVVWDLKAERELIERAPDQNDEREEKTSLIYDLYYIWRINKAVISLSKDLGAQVQKKEKKLSDSLS